MGESLDTIQAEEARRESGSLRLHVLAIDYFR